MPISIKFRNLGGRLLVVRLAIDAVDAVDAVEVVQRLQDGMLAEQHVALEPPRQPGEDLVVHERAGGYGEDYLGETKLARGSDRFRNSQTQ